MSFFLLTGFRFWVFLFFFVRGGEVVLGIELMASYVLSMYFDTDLHTQPRSWDFLFFQQFFC
jgi:hypothetical protein